MASLRVLLTNRFFRGQSGTEMYVHDVALRLLARGHRPIVYSSALGPLAQRLSDATINVVSDLTQISEEPDVIHGQHSLETLQALLHFPRLPAIYVCHDWNWVHDTPPQLPRVRRYVAVDETVRDRLIVQEGIADSLVEVIFNGVDLDRFGPREPLPRRPQKALAISNYLQRSQLDVISAACHEHAIELDAIGAKLGGACPRPEEVLGQYDIVFAKARCAWEALAVGAAVIICDAWGVGPLVTTAQLDSLRRANFGRRLLQQPLRADVLADQIARYDADDAAEVSRHIRATAGLDKMVDRLLDSYAAAIAAQRAAAPDVAADMRAAAGFLSSWPALRPVSRSVAASDCLSTDADHLRRIIRAELQRNRQTTGLRKWLRSLRKHWPLAAFSRRAA